MFLSSSLVLLLLSSALPESFADYMYQHRYACVGPFADLSKPVELSIGKNRYRLTGSRMVQLSREADSAEVKLGVLSAIKDFSSETRGNLHYFLDWFEREGVETLILNGDLAMNEDDLDDLLAWLGDRGLPTFVLSGNSESAGSFARATRRAHERYPNIINLGWVRQIVGPGYELISLPGYHDRRFMHVGSACGYKQADIDDTVFSIGPAQATRILVSHGPPQGRGKQALDLTAEGEHVGDPALNRLIERLDISFGIHGHILEAGGRAVAADQRQGIREGRYSPSLFINAGSANGLPWRLLDNSVSTGMAAIFSVRDNTAAVYFDRRR